MISRRRFDAARSWSSSRPRIRAPPRSSCARSSSGPASSAGPTSSSATRRSASIRGTQPGPSRNTPKVVSGIDDESRRRGRSVLRHPGRQGRARELHGRSRARQAPGEHVPPRQHRARERARDVRRATSASTSGLRSTPRPPSRSGTCASRPVPASADTACRSIRGTSPGGSNSDSGTGSASWSSPTTSTATCPTTSSSARSTSLNREQRAVSGSRILLLGLAYKAATSDWRESPSTRVAQLLSDLGGDVRVHDTHIPGAPTSVSTPRVFPCTREELESADLVVVLVDHPDLPYDDICASAGLVLDTKGCLRGPRVPRRVAVAASARCSYRDDRARTRASLASRRHHRRWSKRAGMGEARAGIPRCRARHPMGGCDGGRARRGPTAIGASPAYERFDRRRYGTAENDMLARSDVTPVLERRSVRDFSTFTAGNDRPDASDLDVLLDFRDAGTATPLASVHAEQWRLELADDGGSEFDWALASAFASRSSICHVTVIAERAGIVSRTESVVALNPTSLVVSQGIVYQRAAALFIRRMRSRLRDESKHDDELDATTRVPEARSGSSLPGSRWLAGFAARRVASAARARYEKLQGTREQWIVGIRRRSPELSFDDPRAYVPVPPPDDRMYADPFVVDHEGRTYVFLEELPFATGKGVISVAELLPGDELSEPPCCARAVVPPVVPVRVPRRIDVVHDSGNCLYANDPALRVRRVSPSMEASQRRVRGGGAARHHRVQGSRLVLVARRDRDGPHQSARRASHVLQRRARGSMDLPPLQPRGLRRSLCTSHGGGCSSMLGS